MTRPNDILAARLEALAAELRADKNDVGEVVLKLRADDQLVVGARNILPLGVPLFAGRSEPNLVN